jgi:pseudomonalisin
MSSRSIPLIRTAVVALAAACGLGSVAVASAQTSDWVATHTHALHLNGQLLGHAPAATRLEISAVLPLRDAGAIQGLIASHQIFTAAQVRARFSPTSATVASVAGYLHRQGFQAISVAGNRLLVTGYATVAQAERAFDTTISSYRLSGRTIYANTRAASVPATLAGSVVAVLGLSDVPMSVPHVAAAAHTAAASGSPDLSGFTPQALENAYQATGLPPAKGTEIAVLTSGDMTPTIKDLRTAESSWKYPQVPVNVIYDGPRAGIVNNNPLTGNAEWSLDTQISTEMAHDVKQLDIYDVGTFTDPEVARGINMFVSDNRASSLSVSLGECDYIAFLDGAMITSDEALAEGALQGQSSFASTGDNGYACPEGASTGLPEGPPGVSWPSDGEYTAAVGGTTLVADSDGNVSNEVAWIGGGGGISPWETAAPWTLQANAAGQTWEYTNQGGRGVPDVAAVADANTPVLIYAGGSQTAVGGTSVASPLTMGLWSRVNDTSGDTFGLAQYDFYYLYDNTNPATTVAGPLGPTYTPASGPIPVLGFRDITLGTNGGCVAQPGYDYCTGIGALQATDLAKALIPLAGSAGAHSSGSGASGAGSSGAGSSGTAAAGGGSAGSGSSGSSTSPSSGSAQGQSTAPTSTPQQRVNAKSKPRTKSKPRAKSKPAKSHKKKSHRKKKKTVRRSRRR